jgi:hypothetical protein
MRYGIYYVPLRGTKLAEFGAAVLGYDLDRGQARPRLALPGVSEDRLVQATRRAARYGFHATLKAPFRLAAGLSRVDVLKAAADIADTCRPAIISGLELAMLGTFVAFRPQGSCADVDMIAESFVRGLDHLRATEERDDAKWPPDRLSAREEELRRAWGYPYVLDQYRFHMTVTDVLESADAAAFMAYLLMGSASFWVIVFGLV